MLVRKFLLFICVLPYTLLAKESYIVNIDNPAFRKLIVALPDFEVEPAEDKKMLEIAKLGRIELAHLFEFSALFHIMDKTAYEDLAKKALSQPPAPSTAPKGMEGIDATAWKSLGVESLTMVKLIRLVPGNGFRVEIRTYDLTKSERILGKGYTLQKEDDLREVLKRYMDRLLEVYTGKPGIFSSKLVFVGRKSPNTEKQLYISDVDGKNLVQLSNFPNPHLAPTWSPDGKKILFTAYEAKNPDLYMLDLQKKSTIKVSAHRGINTGGAFAPNSKLIAFIGSIEGDSEIYVGRPDGSNKRFELIKGGGINVDPAFSPDGKWLAFVSGRFANPHIFRAELKWEENGEVVKILNDKRLTFAGWHNTEPAWSPDSQKIVFTGFDKDTNRFDLFIMNHDGTQLERLTLKTGDNKSPSFSPNGQLVVFHSNRVPGKGEAKGISQLYMMNKDGTNQQIIYTGLYEAQTPKWGPYMLDAATESN